MNIYTILNIHTWQVYLSSFWIVELKSLSFVFQVHSQREESYEKLQKHRQILKEDKHILMEHEREHNRLLKIGAKTDIATESYWYTARYCIDCPLIHLKVWQCHESILLTISLGWYPHYLQTRLGQRSVLLKGAGSYECFNRCMKNIM